MYRLQGCLDIVAVGCSIRASPSLRLWQDSSSTDSRDDSGVRAIEIQGPAARTSHWTGTADDMVWYGMNFAT